MPALVVGFFLFYAILPPPLNPISRKKIIADSSAKKWHILVIVYLLAIVAYIAYFAVCHRILMIGFLIATLFMLFFELRIFIKEKIYRQNRNCHAE
jgi:hypothetical protein